MRNRLRGIKRNWLWFVCVCVCALSRVFYTRRGIWQRITLDDKFLRVALERKFIFRVEITYLKVTFKTYQKITFQIDSREFYSQMCSRLIRGKFLKKVLLYKQLITKDRNI